LVATILGPAHRARFRVAARRCEDVISTLRATSARLDPNEEVLAELRKIRELLTKPPPPPPAKGISQEFRAFLAKYQVLGLAVAFIIGIYLGAVVKALVTDLILPLVQFALPAGSANINGYMVGPFGIGDFANTILTFVIVALVIFLIVKAADRFKIQ
jgi:large conductance mechanosensitive channel